MCVSKRFLISLLLHLECNYLILSYQMSFEARYLLYNLFFHLILFLVLNDLMVG